MIDQATNGERELKGRIDEIEMMCRRLDQQISTIAGGSRRYDKALAKYAVLLVVPIAFLMGGAAMQRQDIDAGTVSCEKLVIRDGGGKMRALVGLEQNRAIVKLYDKEERRGVELGVHDNGFSSFHMFYPDQQGKYFAIGMVAAKNGFTSIAIRDAQSGATTLHLHGEAGGSEVVVSDQKGHVRTLRPTEPK